LGIRKWENPVIPMGIGFALPFPPRTAFWKKKPWEIKVIKEMPPVQK